MNWDKAQKATAKIMIYSLLEWVNNLKTFDDDEKEDIMTLLFNVITNSLKPDMALIFNETILNVPETNWETKENMLKIVMDQLNWNED